ncbi:L-histidine N(alpha)-methyltransferase [Streptomyces sp. NPDC050738]|uniref:L-histidine N(alpha)-methyltransferase n=1 Tax=Streptomyces sp. NPDC050738 TaxID=3154744 RepID=UPI003441F005
MADLIGFLDDTDEGRWSTLIVGEDQSDKFTQITHDLNHEPSPTGDGKRFASGSSYWGVESTMAWIQACTDLYYPVMRQSISSFQQRLAEVSDALGTQPYHYVSLGTGTGEKDNAVLRRLSRGRPPHPVRFIPVDISAEMLRHGARTALRETKVRRRDTIPVQMDFSTPRALKALRHIADRITGDTPVVYSLLGNTLANFDDDLSRLTAMATELLRPQDRFLLEVATTDRIDQRTALRAAFEYQNSPRFHEFVTSAIMHYTDLQIHNRSVEYQGEVDDERALKIKILYRNNTGQVLRPMLPNRTTFDFPDGDTIRLLTTRKYAPQPLADLITQAGLTEIAHCAYEPDDDGDTSADRAHFGLRLALLKATDPHHTATGPGTVPNPFA